MNEAISTRSDHSPQYENVVRMLRQIQEQQAEMNTTIGELKVMRDALVRDITLDNRMLEIILEVSDSTLYRWRNAPSPNNLPYYMRENGTIYYDYDEVLKALRKGNLTARGFDRLQAIQNMKDYRDDIFHAKDGGSWLISEK